MDVKKFCALMIVLSLSSFMLYSCSSKSSPSSPSGDNPPAATGTETVTGTPPTATYTPTVTETRTPTNTPTITNTRTNTPNATPTLGDDAYEGDWDYTMAKTITSGVQQLHSIYPADDPDWVIFTLTDTYSDISITATSPGNSFDIWVYDDPSTFSTLGSSTSVSPCSVYITGVAAGTYYAKVQSKDQLTQINWYTLLFQAWTAAAPTDTPTETPTGTDTPDVTDTGTPTETETHTETFTHTETITTTPTPMATDVYEPDSNSWTARAISNNTNENFHTLAPAGDEDWYEFVIPSLAQVSLTAASDDQVYDIWLYVYNTSFWAGLDSPQYFAMGNASGNAYVMTQFMAGTYRARIIDHNTADPLWYNFHFSFITCTPTDTDTPTDTPTFTPTSPATTDYSDAYEPDNVSYTAKPITDGETQNRTSFPDYDYDWLYFDTTVPMVVSTTAVCGSGEYIWLALYNSTGVQFDTYIVQEGDMTETTNITIYLATAGRYWLRASSAGITSTYSLSMLYMTPTYTYTPTNTETITITYTATITYTPTETRTITNTPTPTPYWHTYGSYGAAGSSYPVLDSYGSTLYYGWQNGTNLYVNGTAISCSPSGIHEDWLGVSATNQYVTFSDAGYNIYARSSANWSANLGGGSLGTGAYTTIFMDGDTPYVANIDMLSNSKATVKYYNGSSWQDYGTGISNQVYYLASWSLISLSGYNDGTLRLFLAYIDNSDTQRLKVIYTDDGTTWNTFGTMPVQDTVARWIDIEAVSKNMVYVSYTDAYSSDAPRVRVSSGGAWTDVSGTPPYTGETWGLTMKAAGQDNVYVAYRKTSDTYVYVSHFNGTSWSTTAGGPVSAEAAMFPHLGITSMGNYVGFIPDSSGVLKIMSFY